MNTMTFFATLFGTAAIIVAFIALIHFERAELLSETLQDANCATGALISRCDALEVYVGHLKAANRHYRACKAGALMVRLALDVEERLWMADGERNVP